MTTLLRKRACLDCEADISEMPHNTKRCRGCKKESQKKHNQAWNAANPERVRELKRANYKARSEKRREHWRAWRAANLERVREIQKAWRAANPERVREIERRRKARKRGLLGNVTPGSTLALLQKQAYHCAGPGCRKRIGKRVKGRLDYHVDHIIPLASGGLHDNANLQVLCVKCNLSKGAKDPIVFARERGLLF